MFIACETNRRSRLWNAGWLVVGLLFSSASTAVAASNLLISEYVEGSSNNKAIELYNNSDEPIDLAAGNYAVRIYFNGSSSLGVTINLLGTVPAGGTFVLAQASASPEILAKAQQTSGSGWFNGDDAIELTRSGAVIDSIGQVGFDPGSEWGSGLASTQGNSLRRKPGVVTGRIDSAAPFDPALEWDGYPLNDISDLGQHTGGGSGDAAPFVASTVPAPGGSVATTGTLTLQFSAPVQFSSSALSMQCQQSGAKTLQIAGGPSSYLLTPTTPYSADESCALTVSASGVSGAGASGTPMASDFNLQFSVQASIGACGAAFTPAYTIQGRGNASTLVGQMVTTQGVVVGDYEGPSPALRGFYLQDVDGDNDPATSDAVFVFNGNNDQVQPGQLVRVTGSVSEFQNQTQVSASGIAFCGTASAAPVDVMLPQASLDDFERFEGMLVRLPQTLYVTEHFQLGRFGQVVLSSGSRLWQPTNVVLPGAEALAMQAQNDLNRIILDDGENGQNPATIVFGRHGGPLSAANTLRGGDTATAIVGVMTYTWAGNAASGNAWRVRPAYALGAPATDFRGANPRPDTAPAPAGLRVAGVNVLNYFNSFGVCAGGVGGIATDCRGAEDAAEFERQQAKTVAALVAMEADVVGLVEIENDGYGATSAQRNLVDTLNAATAPGTWAVLDVDARTGQINAMGADAIKVGLIYRSARVAPVGTTAVLGTAAFQNAGDSAPRNRPAVAQAFQQIGGEGDGERFIAVVNHLKSKGSACDAPDAGDGQGNCNAVRTRATQMLRDWLAADPTGTGDPDVLVFGDLNAYAKEDPIRGFTDNGWVDLIARGTAGGGYTYVFNGQWGYLDHALATAALSAQVVQVVAWPISADEPSVLDYNVNFKTAGQIASLYAPDPYRNSDHDPVLVDLRLLPAGSCARPDPSPVVVFGATSSGVVNRVVDKGCTVDDLIADEQTWGSQSAFLLHVSKITVNLLRQRKISAAERSQLMAAAISSGIGLPPVQ